MAELGRKADVGLTTLQRFWRNSATASKGGPPLESVHLKTLEDIAAALGVHPRELIAFEDEIKKET